MRTIDQARLDPREREALEQAVRLLKAQFPVERLVFFGSRARGEGGDDSDVDLLVITSRAIDWRERWRLVDALFDLGLAYDVQFSPLVVERRDWAEGPLSALPLRAEVDRDGIVV